MKHTYLYLIICPVATLFSISLISYSMLPHQLDRSGAMLPRIQKWVVPPAKDMNRVCIQENQNEKAKRRREALQLTSAHNKKKSVIKLRSRE